jgi:hypothetical protein
MVIVTGVRISSVWYFILGFIDISW